MNPSTNAGDAGSIPGLRSSPEKTMATHSSILAWEFPCRSQTAESKHTSILNFNRCYPIACFPRGTVVKNLPANTGDTKDAGSSLGMEDVLEQEMATHSHILAWKIPWTEEPGGLQSIGSQRVGHD